MSNHLQHYQDQKIQVSLEERIAEAKQEIQNLEKKIKKTEIMSGVRRLDNKKRENYLQISPDIITYLNVQLNLKKAQLYGLESMLENKLGNTKKKGGKSKKRKIKHRKVSIKKN